MKIEKPQEKIRIVPKRKEESQEPKSVDIPNSNPEEKKPKIEISESKVSKSKFEDLKRKREQIFKQAALRQKQIQNNALLTKKRSQIYRITAIVTTLGLFLFAPIYPNQELKVGNLDYLQMSDLKIDKPLGKYFSPFQFLVYSSEVKSGSEYIKAADITYKLREMTTYVNITEYKPLAKDSENNIYFFEHNEVVKKSNIDLYAPVITGFDQDKLESLLESLGHIDYNIISQIDTIEYIGTEEDPNLLKMGMVGNNTLYIDIEQIKSKMPYYGQIKQIIDEKADGKPGVIHLDIGDYYEPK